MDCLTKKDKKAVDKVFKKAEKAKPKFDKANQKIADKLGGQYIAPPLKGRERALEKMNGQFGGDAGQLTDVVRSTFEVKTPADAQKALAEIKKNFKTSDVGFRNLLEKGSTTKLYGYRDIRVHVMSNGSPAEIQINIPEMLEVKQKMHKHFEIVSKLDRAAKVEGRALSPAELAQKKLLVGEMEAAYDAVWKKFFPGVRV